MKHKYNIGDVVKVQYRFKEVIGVIIEIDDPETAYPFITYTVIVQGIEGMHRVHEEEIEGKIE